MFRKTKDKEIDITALNSLIKVAEKLLSIGYIMLIVGVVLLATFLLKEWKILAFIGEILKIISPLFIGFLIAWLFEPMVSKLQNKKMPRIVGCILVYLILIGCLIAVSYLFIPTLVTQVKDFVASAPGIFEELTDFSINLIEKFDTNSFINTKELKDSIMTFMTDFGMSIASDLPKYVLSIGKSIVNGGMSAVLGLMLGFYLLYDFPKVNQSVRKFMPRKWEQGYLELIQRINTSLRGYVQGVLIIMLLVFLTQTIGLTLAGMEAPIVFALFCALTDIIPYFGPYIGGIPAVIVGFTISPITGICVLISIVIVQLLENNFYQPLIMGHTMDLHPVTIMLGLLIFQHFFGILGMVIATPVIACLKVFAIFFDEKFGITNRFVQEEVPVKATTKSNRK